MHREALDFVARHARAIGLRLFVVDLGGRDVNGSPRDFFRGARYVSVDLVPGRGVDVVADARTWTPGEPCDTVLCLEVLEHAPEPLAIVENARRMLAPGGVLILTAACDARAPHSCVDGGPLRPGEYYKNLDPNALREHLNARWERCHVEVHRERGDVYAIAWKGDEPSAPFEA